MRHPLASLAFLLAAACSFGQIAAPPTPLPILPAVTVEEAQSKIEHGQTQEAIVELQKLAAMRPSVKGASRGLGIAYYRTGKLNDAEKHFAQAMADDPTDKESEQMRGLTLYRLWQPAAAIPYLEHARQWISSANVDVNYVLARCYIAAQRFDDARVALASQYDVDPESSAAYLLIAQILVGQDAELPDIAAQNALKALQLSPNLPLAHLLLGKIFLTKADTANAAAQFERELRVNPAYPPVYEFLGDLYLRTGQLQQAQQALTRAISLEQNSSGPYILMGKVFLGDNDPQTAATYLEHAEQMDPANDLTHSLLGQAYRAMGRKQDATREFGAVAKAHSDSRLMLQPLP